MRFRGIRSLVACQLSRRPRALGLLKPLHCDTTAGQKNRHKPPSFWKEAGEGEPSKRRETGEGTALPGGLGAQPRSPRSAKGAGR